MESSALVTSFSADLEFLKQHADVVLLSAAHGGQIAVSAQYQARVMTSAVSAGTMPSSIGKASEAPRLLRNVRRGIASLVMSIFLLAHREGGA